MELHVKLSQPPMLFCDNLSIKHLATNHIQHAQKKHVEIDWHFIHDQVTFGELEVKFVPSAN